jgi:medium-chain acyl-[acyl-carrier-protein] hydrolase
MATGRSTFNIKTAQLDFRRRIPLYVLYQCLQESAENNAVELGFDTETLLRQNLTWMLVRMSLLVRQLPVGRQPIVVETWPSGVESRMAFREFRVFTGHGTEPFLVASSTWFMVNIEKQRPVNVQGHFPPDLLMLRERVIQSPIPSLEKPHEVIFRKKIPIRLADVDLNGHVNNTHYIEWLTEAVPETIWREREIHELHVEYKRQARYGDSVLIETGQTSDGFLHSMTASGSGAELFRAATRWV